MVVVLMVKREREGLPASLSATIGWEYEEFEVT